MNGKPAEHIQVLEEKLNTPSAAKMLENDLVKRNDLEAELRAVESALAHYRPALGIQSRVTAKFS